MGQIDYDDSKEDLNLDVTNPADLAGVDQKEIRHQTEEEEKSVSVDQPTAIQQQNQQRRDSDLDYQYHTEQQKRAAERDAELAR